MNNKDNFILILMGIINILLFTRDSIDTFDKFGIGVGITCICLGIILITANLFIGE